MQHRLRGTVSFLHHVCLGRDRSQSGFEPLLQKLLASNPRVRPHRDSVLRQPWDGEEVEKVQITFYHELSNIHAQWREVVIRSPRRCSGVVVLVGP